jgi:hypothetical protein
MHFHYKVNDLIIGKPANQDDATRIASYLNNNEDNMYSVDPGFGSNSPVIDVVNRLFDDKGVIPVDMMVIKKFGYLLTQIDEYEFKEAFSKAQK